MLLARVQHGPPTPIHEIRRDVPRELEAICNKAMARDIPDRYVHMTDLAVDLRAYLEQRVVAAYDSGAIAELRKWVQRNKPMVYTSAIAAALLCFSAITILFLTLRSLRAENRATQQAAMQRDFNRQEARRARQVEQWLQLLLWVIQNEGPKNSAGEPEILSDLTHSVERLEDGLLRMAASANTEHKLALAAGFELVGGLHVNALPHSESGKALNTAATQLLLGAYRTRRELGDQNSPELIECTLWLIQGLAADGDYDRAQVLAMDALNASRLHRDDEPRLLVRCLISLGHIIISMDEAQKATTLLEEAVSVEREAYGTLLPETVAEIMAIAASARDAGSAPLSRQILRLLE